MSLFREPPWPPQSFDEIDVLILEKIDACRIGARSVGVGSMQVEDTKLTGRDRHRNPFARGEIGDNCLPRDLRATSSAAMILRRRVATAEALPRAGVNCEQAAIGLAAKFLRYFAGGVRGDDVNAKKKNPEQHARGSWK